MRVCGLNKIIAATGFCLMLGATPVLAQGYDGLFAPDDGAPAVAPSAEPQGYQGLIPGAAAPAPAARAVAPAATAPAATATQPQNNVPRPVRLPSTVAAPSPAMPAAAAAPVQPIRSSADLVSLARLHSLSGDPNAVTDAMAASARLPANMTELLKQPRPRINGMLPMENNIKASIDSTLQSLRAPNLRPEDRAARTRLAVESLNTLKRGLAVKSGISDRTYQAMGMPPLYIKEERESVQNSLARIDAALGQLQ